MENLHLEFAALEVGSFLVLTVMHRRGAKHQASEQQNLMDEGPWWSVAYHRVWLACHIPALLLSIAATSFLKLVGIRREIGMPLIMFPVVNYAAIAIVLNS